MKLYTEEQLLNTIKSIRLYDDLYDWKVANERIEKHLKALHPIELPPRTEPCKHESFVMDKQIRVIECKQCGMKSWLEKDHVDLFPPKKQANR